MREKERLCILTAMMMLVMNTEISRAITIDTNICVEGGLYSLRSAQSDTVLLFELKNPKYTVSDFCLYLSDMTLIGVYKKKV